MLFCRNRKCLIKDVNATGYENKEQQNVWSLLEQKICNHLSSTYGMTIITWTKTIYEQRKKFSYSFSYIFVTMYMNYANVICIFTLKNKTCCISISWDKNFQKFKSVKFTKHIWKTNNLASYFYQDVFLVKILWLYHVSYWSF